MSLGRELVFSGFILKRRRREGEKEMRIESMEKWEMEESRRRGNSVEGEKRKWVKMERKEREKKLDEEGGKENTKKEKRNEANEGEKEERKKKRERKEEKRARRKKEKDGEKEFINININRKG